MCGPSNFFCLCAPAFTIPEEAHNQDILANLERLGTRYLCRAESPEIAQLFLRPQAHHLPGVLAIVASPKAVLARDVLVAILENQDRSLEDFERQMRGVGRQCVIDVGLARIII